MRFKAKVYAVVNNEDISNIDITPSNIASLTFVAFVEHQPDESSLIALYDIYTQIQAYNYENTYFIVGFTDGADSFGAVANNYTVYGKSNWEDWFMLIFRLLKPI